MIAAVVLTYAAPPGMLEDCLRSVLDAGGVEVYLVDNGSSAATRLAVRSDLGECRLIVTGGNGGFAAGMNAGIRIALADGADIVVILNDDVVVEPGWLAPLLEAFAGGEQAGQRIGAVQPKLLLAGTEPRLVNSLGVHLGPDGAGRDIGIGEADTGDREPHDIELFTGGAVALSAAFLGDVGLFDERYFLYYEDVDLGLRGTERGWSYRCAPSSRVVHRGGVSTSQQPDRTAYLRERNRLLILLRYRPGGHVLRGFWLSVRRLRHSPRLVHLRALGAGVVAAPRQLTARFRAGRFSG